MSNFLFRRTAAVVLAAVTCLALAGCSNGGSPDEDGDAGSAGRSLYERTITLTDGRTVTCVEFAAGYKGGVSCDWDNAK